MLLFFAIGFAKLTVLFNPNLRLILRKVDQTKLPNKLHFEVQKNTRTAVFKPKKGKGSYIRKKKVEEE